MGPAGDGTIDRIHLEAPLVSGSPTLDFGNLLPGDLIQLRAVGIHHPSAGGSEIVTVAVTSWRTNAPSSVATVTPAGLMSVNGGSAGQAYTVQCNYAGTTLTQSFLVKTAGAVIAGRVRNTTGNGSVYTLVKFYDASGTLLAQAFTGLDGTFRVVVPATATNFTVDTSASFGIYYGVFAFGTPTYNGNQQGCKAQLPALTSTSSIVLPHDIVVFDNPGSGPPEPPSGCF